jgi:hypothetical protein
MPEDFVAHPVVAPLLTYDLPVRYWGGRSLFVEALTGNAATSALIYAESPYGETGRLDLRSGDQAQYTFNIDQDTQGRLLLGALARRPATGSRVAVLGDSEIFRNQFGLARIVTQQSLPRYPGDQLLVERLVHWLIGLPLETWPTLPPEFTPIVVDGQDDDWLPGAALIGLGEVSSGTVRAAIDDQFLYVSIAPPEGISAPDLTAQLSFPQEAGTSVLQVEGGALVDLANPGVPIADSTVAVSHNMELRVPLRVASVVLNQVCIGHASTADRTVCTAAPVEATTLGTLAPVIQYGVPGPAAVPREDMNVRTGPGLEYEAIELLRDRPPLRVLGRSENGEWIRVDSGRTSGWAFRQLLNLNVGLDLLPVLE